MGDVRVFHNPFDRGKEEIHHMRRRMTVRRFLSATQKGRTSVRVVNGRRVRDFNRPTICVHNGRYLLRSDWSRTTIGENDVVVFATQLPRGGGFGGGGGGGSNPLPIVMALAIAVAAPYLAGIAAGALVSAGIASAATFAAGSIGASLLTAGIGLALGAAAVGIMSLFAPPPASTAAASNFDSGYGSTPQVSPTFNLQAQGNTARLQQPIPVLHGKHQIFCDYVMPPYSRYDSNDQYLSTLLAVSEGEVDIEDVRIGDTPASSFASIEWEKVEPGATVPTDKVDTRFVPCTDLSDSELEDAGAGSPWVGPFAANPPGTLINRLEVDFVAPRGLFKFNASGGFDSKSVTFEIQVQEIDDTGATLGSWSTLATETESAADNSPQRYTLAYNTASASRWQVRVRRTDSKDGSATAGHEIHWTGLRGRMLSARIYANMTLLAVKMKATGDLNGITSRQVNVIATRKLPTWDPDLNDGAGGMTTTVATTRSICDAFADVARNTVYGAGLRDDQVDLAGLYAYFDELEEKNWHFDYVWDTSTTCWDALTKIAMTALGVPIIQGGKLRLVRDVPVTAPAMMFTPRNIRKQSLAIEYKMVDEQTADSVQGTIIDPNSWKPVTLPIAALETSPQKNTTTMPLTGVTDYDHGWAILWYFLRVNLLRRRVVGWGTEMEGLLLFYGDGVSFSYDFPNWGQSAEIIAWDADTRVATLSEPMTFTTGTHYIALRDAKGLLAGPFEATPGANTNEIVVGEGDLPEIFTGGDRERTYIQFGPGQAYARPIKVTAVQPRDFITADILGVDDDPGVYADPPPRPIATIGVPTDPIEIHISADVANINLRNLADMNDPPFSGLFAQQVTFYLDASVDVYSVTTAAYALVRGSWPTDYQPILVMRGTSTGAGAAAGAGGDANFNTVGAGAQGGPAIDTRSGPLKIVWDGGSARGGGGGGGGGGWGAIAGEDGNAFYGGGGGGGGRGHVGGAAGPGGTAPAGPSGSPGGGGSPSAPGSGGAGSNDPFTGDGGSGGDLGSPGSPGGTGNFGGSPTPGGPGGPAGYSIVGYSNVTNVGTPSLVGPTSP